jgi:hypothetical protein
LTRPPSYGSNNDMRGVLFYSKTLRTLCCPMKLFKTLMLVYQYAYYAMIEWDKYTWKEKLAEVTSRYKAILVFMIVESLALYTLYILLVNVMLGFPIHGGSSTPAAAVCIFVFSFPLMTFNRFLIGHPKRPERYRKIFNRWDKRKRLRWSTCLILAAISIFALFILVVQASRKVLVL